MKKIALHGSFQGTNFGDTLLLSIYSHWIREIDSNIQIFATNSSEHAASIAGVERITQKDVIKQKIPVVFCGGGYFGEPLKNKIRWGYRAWNKHFSFGVQLYKNSIPYCISGLGFGPINNYFLRRFAISILNRADFVSLRDWESVEYVNIYKANRSDIISSADSVLAFDLPELIRILNADKYSSIDFLDAREFNFDPAKQYLAIHLQAPKGSKQYERKTLLKLIFDEINKRNDIECIFISDSISAYRDFYEWSKKNNQLMGYAKYYYYDSPIKLLKILNYCNYIITTKLHVGIIGATGNKRVLSFSNHSKIKRFYKQVKRPELIISLDDFDIGKYRIMLKGLLNNTPAPITIKPEIKCLANINKDIIKQFIAKY